MGARPQPGRPVRLRRAAGRGDLGRRGLSSAERQSRACSPSTSSSCPRFTPWRSRTRELVCARRLPRDGDRRQRARLAGAAPRRRPSSASGVGAARQIASDLLRGAGLEDELEDRAGTARCSARLARDRARSATRPHGDESRYPLSVDGRRSARCTWPRGAVVDAPPASSRRSASLLAVRRARAAVRGRRSRPRPCDGATTIKTAVIRAVSHDLRTPLGDDRAGPRRLESAKLAAHRRRPRRAARHDPPRARAAQAPRREPPRPLATPGRRRRPGAELWTARRARRAGGRRVGAPDRSRSSRPTMPPVRVDAVQIQRASSTCSRTRFASRRRAKPYVRVTATRKELIVRVVDHGPGVPEDEQERIFEPFHRVGDRAARSRARARDRARLRRGERRPALGRVAHRSGRLVRARPARRRAPGRAGG